MTFELISDVFGRRREIGRNIAEGCDQVIVTYLNRVKNEIELRMAPVTVPAEDIQRLLHDPAYEHQFGPALFAFAGMKSPKEIFDRAMRVRGLWIDLFHSNSFAVTIMATFQECDECYGHGVVQRRVPVKFPLATEEFDPRSVCQVELCQCPRCAGRKHVIL